MPTVEQTQAKVQQILKNNLNSFQMRGDTFGVEVGSTMCQVSVHDFGDDRTTVLINAFILGDVPLTDEVFRYVALQGGKYRFGGLVLLEDGTLFFSETLLGDYLDEDELMVALVAVATTADELDDELQAKFGGKRLVDM